MVEVIDPRLTKDIAQIIEGIEGKIEIYDNVDISHIDLYANKDGGKSVKFFEIVGSDDTTDITRKDDSGNVVEEKFVVIGDYPSNIIPKSPTNLKGDLSKTEEFLPHLKAQLGQFAQGVDNREAKNATTKRWLTRVRQYMNVMGDVFGFNTPEQLEVFIAAWCTQDSTTRLTGIPGTGKTTLIECASMLFANAYGFNEDGAPMGQVWDSDRLRSREVREAWDATRFNENSYKYPFDFLVNTVGGLTLDSIHEATKGMVTRRPQYGVGGSLDHKEFATLVDALNKDSTLLLVNGGGVPVIAERDSAEEDTTWTQYTGRKIKRADETETEEVHYYYGVPISHLQRKVKECAKHYNLAQKDTDGRPTDVGKLTSASNLSDAQWFFDYGELVNSMLSDVGNLSSRDFVAKWYYDQRRTDSKLGLRSIDNEMRREIGTAKIDKDKRAEQVLYGVEIQSKDITGGSQYVFEPYPRPIVTQPIKFFNEINRSQPGVEDAILGLIAEKEVEYRGQVFNSPNFVNWMDNNPHVGGNDLAFTDRIDIELLFPSALLDQRFKVLKAKNDRGGRGSGGAVLKPRQRVLQAILEGKVRPIRWTELQNGVWDAVNTVKFSAPGYNALMDIAIVSMLFSQRFAVHPDAASISGEGIPTPFAHERRSGDYENSIKPLTSSGWFVDASVTENVGYRTNIAQSEHSLRLGHGVFTLLNRVLAFRFTNSLAKFARSLAWLRGNQYVTRKEVMDMLPYVVGHRIGRARGDNNQVVFGITDDAANKFQSGQEFVKEAIVEGYISRNIESFLSDTGAAGGNAGKQSRWIEWDSMIAQARKDLATSPTYADYEKKMWGMAKLGAIGDGTQNTATGDPYPYLIYRLILMEELTATGETSMHPFQVQITMIEDGKEVKDTVNKNYNSRVEHYQKEVLKFITMNRSYSANDIGELRKKISIERWLITDDKRALLTQIDSILDGMTGSQIPDKFSPPSGADAVKYWGPYSACTDDLPQGYPVGLDATSILGFPLNDYIRTYTWYGGSATGRTLYYLYRGQTTLLDDAYPDIKGTAGNPVTDAIAGATYPVASKLNAQQSATLQMGVESAEASQTLKTRFNNLLADLNNGSDFTLVDGTAVDVADTVGGAASDGETLEWLKNEINAFIDTIQTSTNPRNENDARNQRHMCIEVTHMTSQYKDQIMPEDEDRLRLWVSAYGSVGGAGNTRKVCTLNFCLSSAFVLLDGEGKPQVISTTDTTPFGSTDAGPISDIAQTYRNSAMFTFFDAGNITTTDVDAYTNILQTHNIG